MNKLYYRRECLYVYLYSERKTKNKLTVLENDKKSVDRENRINGS